MVNKKNTYTPITIETLILVAVWEPPFVFQGSFKLLDKLSHMEHFFFYRCECIKVHKMDVLEQDFSPYDYQFTHLYHATEQSHIEFLGYLSEDALYLLKYALHVSITQMITNNKQHQTYIDELALIAISKRIKSVLREGLAFEENEEIGFAVSMDFNPSEQMAQQAVNSLFQITSS